jgi:hypothetical protein
LFKGTETRNERIVSRTVRGCLIDRHLHPVVTRIDKAKLAVRGK